MRSCKINCHLLHFELLYNNSKTQGQRVRLTSKCNGGLSAARVEALPVYCDDVGHQLRAYPSYGAAGDEPVASKITTNVVGGMQIGVFF